MSEGVTTTRPAILYDGDCGMCRAQMRWVSRLDWFHALRLLPNDDPRVPSLAPSLTRDQLDEAIHCVATDGTTTRGARCLRFIGMRVPLLLPLALLLWIPGVTWLAEKFYRWGARNRSRLSRFFPCKDHCGLPPETPARRGRE